MNGIDRNLAYTSFLTTDTIQMPPNVMKINMKEIPFSGFFVVVTLSFNAKMVLANFECNLNDYSPIVNPIPQHRNDTALTPHEEVSVLQ